MMCNFQLLLVLLVVPSFFVKCESIKSKEPHILWWHSLGQTDEVWRRQCGDVSCTVSTDRTSWSRGEADVILFYGTDLNVSDLPLPRRSGDIWALLHEESPINKMMLFRDNTTQVFNISSTFQRGSDFPLTGKEILNADWLTTDRYLTSVEEKNRLMQEEGLAPIVYLQSNCVTASDRDALVKELSKFIPIDSYGKCLNNKSMPSTLEDPVSTMYSHELYNFLKRYKFTLAFENFRCDDYVTEKFWRPLHVGSVPVVLSTPAAKDLAPDDHSAIFVHDFKYVEDLAKYIHNLNNNDTAYMKYLNFKHRGRKGIRNRVLRNILRRRRKLIDMPEIAGETSFEQFECLLCERAHDYQSKTSVHFQTYSAQCPVPMAFAKDGRIAWIHPFPITTPDHASAFLDSRWEGRMLKKSAKVTASENLRERNEL